jgi:hypothetical protein
VSREGAARDLPDFSISFNYGSSRLNRYNKHNIPSKHEITKESTINSTNRPPSELVNLWSPSKA